MDKDEWLASVEALTSDLPQHVQDMLEGYEGFVAAHVFADGAFVIEITLSQFWTISGCDEMTASTLDEAAEWLWANWSEMES